MAVFLRMVDELRSKEPNPATISHYSRDATVAPVKTVKSEAATARNPRLSSAIDGDADWGRSTRSAEHPLARVRSGKPRPGRSQPGSPNGPFNEVCHLNSFAKITNSTTQQIRNNKTQQIRNNKSSQLGQTGAVGKFEIPACIVREHDFHTRQSRRFPLLAKTRSVNRPRGHQLTPGVRVGPLPAAG
jgi:hypothetical protein